MTGFRSFFCFAVMLPLCFGGCGKGGSVPEGRDFYRDMIAQTNEYADKLEKVKDAASATEIINSYAEARKKLYDRGRELREKYPQLKFRDDPELKEYESALEDAVKKLSIIMSDTVKKYISVNEFRNALKKLNDTADKPSE